MPKPMRKCYVIIHLYTGYPTTEMYVTVDDPGLQSPKWILMRYTDYECRLHSCIYIHGCFRLHSPEHSVPGMMSTLTSPNQGKSPNKTVEILSFEFCHQRSPCFRLESAMPEQLGRTVIGYYESTEEFDHSLCEERSLSSHIP